MKARLANAVRIIGALGALSACGASDADQARALIARLDALEVDGTFSERRRRIDELAEVPLSADHLTRVRDACLKAHRQLLASEVAQAEVKQALSAGERVLGEADRERLSASLAQSEQALAAAQRAYPTCRDQTRNLVKRYR